MGYYMNKKGGKSRILIILMTVIILIAAVPWYFIISGNLNRDTTAEPTPPTDGSTAAEDVPPVEETPPPEIEPTPTPTPPPETEQMDDITVPVEYIVVDIATEHRELFVELNALAAEYNCVSVSLTAFDGRTGEYFTYVFGQADTATRRSADVDTKYRIASLAKLTTVICAMVLVDAGLIDLDADISLYLGYEVQNTNFPGTPLTTRMLMQHTSSIFDSGAFQSSRDRGSTDSLRVLLERGSSFRRNQPGSHFEYTNFGYAVLGAVIENVAGKSLDTYAREVLFDRLDIDAGYVPHKMRDTENIAVIYNDSHTVTRSVESQLDTDESEVLGHDLHLAQGNLTISVIDYARILVMLKNGGILGDARILSPGAVRAMHNVDVEGVAYEQGLATRHSFGDFMPDEGFFWHTGSAYGLFSQYVYCADLNSNRGVVVATVGATTGREPSGMVSVCTDLSVLVWRVLGFSGEDELTPREIREELQRLDEELDEEEPEQDE